MRIDAALRSATKALSMHSETARLDAELILAHCLQANRSYLYTWPEKELSETAQACFTEAITKRQSLYPVAYILGYQEFWSLPITVTPDVLIPRADTELLVETALNKISSLTSPNILELGTGSGAVSLAIASERPDASIVACDLSDAALSVATNNRNKLDINNIEFILSDWFSAMPHALFDLVVSNPPYVDPEDLHLQSSIKYEPKLALTAEETGLADLRKISKEARHYIKPHGWLIMEHGFDQAKIVKAMLQNEGYESVISLKDLGKNDRITIGKHVVA